MFKKSIVLLVVILAAPVIAICGETPEEINQQKHDRDGKNQIHRCYYIEIMDRK
jgi:hypothetical protein